MSKMQVIGGRAHPVLAQKIARFLKIKLTPIQVKTFADGEIYVRVQQKVRGDDVFLIQTFCPPVNDHLMELLITIDALKRASAARINLVCPYLAYSRQDRKYASREPISAKLIADLLAKAGASRILTVDLHSDQVQGFYDIPFDHFTGYPLFAKHLLKKKYQNIVTVVPDVGGLRRSRQMADLLKTPLAIIDKRRPEPNKAEVVRVIGEVRGKTAVIFDDATDTGGTIAHAARALKKKRAKEIIICVTHGVLSGDACQKLQKCPASKIFLLDTIPLPKEKKIAKIKVLSIAPLLAKIIRRIHRGQSLGALFTWEKKATFL